MWGDSKGTLSATKTTITSQKHAGLVPVKVSWPDRQWSLMGTVQKWSYHSDIVTATNPTVVVYPKPLRRVPLSRAIQSDNIVVQKDKHDGSSDNLLRFLTEIDSAMDILPLRESFCALLNGNNRSSPLNMPGLLSVYIHSNTLPLMDQDKIPP